MPSLKPETELDAVSVQPTVRGDAIVLVRTAIPIAAVGLVNLAMTITDATMMADLDPRALAAGSIIGDIYSIFIQFAAGALSAYTPRIASAFGDKEHRLTGMIMAEGFRASIILGSVGALFIALIPAALLSAGMDLPLPDAARTYAYYMAGTFTFMMIVFFARNVFPALECGSLPVYVLSAAVPLNAFLNGVLMYGWYGLPELGLAGAGASSMAVAFFMAILFAAYAAVAPRLKGLGVAFRIARMFWRMDFVTPREMFFVGAASLCETGIFLISTMMIGFFEMNAVASHIAVFRMVAVTYVLSTGIGQAITIHAARRASRPAAMSSLESSALLVAIVSGPMVMALVYFVPASIFTLLALDDSKIAQIAPFAAISICAMVPTLVIRGFLRAISESVTPAIIGAFGYWFVGFPAMFLLAGPAGYGVVGVWCGLAIGTAVTAAIFMSYFAWKKVIAERFRKEAETWVGLASPSVK